MCSYICSFCSVSSLIPALTLLNSVLLSSSLPYATFDNGNCAAKCLVPIDVDVKCGSDGISYQNMDELECARERCYPDLKFAYDGTCLDSPLEGILPLEGDFTSNSIPNSANSGVQLLPLTQTTFTLSPEATTPSPNTRFSNSGSSSNSNSRPKGEYSKIYFNPKEEESHGHGHHAHGGNGGKRQRQEGPGSYRPYALSHPQPNANVIKSGPEKSGIECSADHCVCDLVLTPVCGTNGATYGNHCILNCIRQCDPAISYHHGGFCGKIFFPTKDIPFFRIFKMTE